MPRDPKQLNNEKYSDFEKEFLRVIDEHGWHVMNVVPLKDDPGPASSSFSASTLP